MRVTVRVKKLNTHHQSVSTFWGWNLFISEGIPISSVYVAPLNSETVLSNRTANSSFFEEFQENIDRRSRLRDSLVDLIVRFPVTTPENSELQISTLVELTKATDELTRKTIVRLKKKNFISNERQRNCFSSLLDIGIRSLFRNRFAFKFETRRNSLSRCWINIEKSTSSGFTAFECEIFGKRLYIFKFDLHHFFF